MQEATHSGHPTTYIVDLINRGVRPYGVSLLLAGYTENPPHKQNPFALYQIDPSGPLPRTPSQCVTSLMSLGSYFPWRATAIGRNASSAKQFLEKRYNPEMELEDAIHTALLTLKEGFEGEMTADTVEIGLPPLSPSYLPLYDYSWAHYLGIVSEPVQHLLGFEGKKGVNGPRFRKLTPDEVQDYLDNL
jgi:20S proteasome subunit alpha 2